MKAYLARRYHFSASHRLHNPAMTDEQNRAVYGKCNNPYGHGHNYVVQVTFGGPVDAVTGMVCDLAALDAFAKEHLLARFDHGNLNTLPEFADRVPSTEHLAVLVESIFRSFPGATLTHVRVEETGNNSFDYADTLAMRPGVHL